MQIGGFLRDFMHFVSNKRLNKYGFFKKKGFKCKTMLFAFTKELHTQD